MATTDKTLLWISRIGVFCIPFIPLIVSASMFFPFITGKNFAFRIIAEIIFASWLLLALRRPEFRPKRSWLLYAVFAFIAVIFFADLFGANPAKSFWSNFERMEGFVTLIHLAAYFLVASSVFNREKWWMRFFATSVGVSAFLGLYGIFQLAGKIVINQGGVRLDGTFGNAAYFAGYMLVHFFLTLFLISRHRISQRVKWLYGAALLLQLFVLYFTATRGAAVGLAGGIMLSAILFVCFERQDRRLRLIAGGAIALVVLISGLLYLGREASFITNNQVLTRFASISLDAAGPRFMVWGMAWQGFKERPLLGWGQEGFNFVFNRYYNPHMWGQEQWFDRTHNICFDWLIAGGALGLLAYLALYAALLCYLWRPRADEPFTYTEKSVLTGLIAAYVVHNFFVFDNLISYLLFFSLEAFMHSRVARANSVQPPFLQQEGALYGAGAVLTLLLLASLYFVNLRNIFAATELIEGLKSHPGGLSENLSFYRQVETRGALAEQELVEQLVQTAARVTADASVPKEVKDAFVATTIDATNKLIARVQGDARLRVFAGSFLNHLGRPSEALVSLQKAHELSPAKQQISFELGSVYLTLGKKEEALALFKTAFEGAPEFETARLYYAAAAVYAGNFKLVNDLLVPRFGTIAVPNDLLIKAYFDVKRYDLVLGVWKTRVLEAPKNPQFRISLAAAYLLVGERQRAIAELQEIIKLKPEARAEVEEYIAKIRAGKNP